MRRLLRPLLAVVALLALATLFLIDRGGASELPGTYVIDWDATEARVPRDRPLMAAKAQAARKLGKESGMDDFELELTPDRRYELRVPGSRRDEFHRSRGAWERSENRVTLHESVDGSNASAFVQSLLIDDDELVMVGRQRDDLDVVLRRK